MADDLEIDVLALTDRAGRSDPGPVRRFRCRRLGLVAAGIALLSVFVLLWCDRDGLRVEYFANVTDGDGRPVYREVGVPLLEGRDPLAAILVSRQIFSIRWRGWLLASTAGDYGFVLRSNQSATLEIDGEAVARVGGSVRRQSRSRWLAAGLHPIDIRYSQRSGRSRLAIEWSPPGLSPTPLDGKALIARRPARVRAFVRDWLGVESGGRRLIGAVFGLAGLLALSQGARGWRPALGSLSVNRRGRAAVLLMLLFIIAGVAIFPYTSPTGDGDDVRYMDAALFGKKMGWNMNRYVHIYSLKAFALATGGDMFLASRLHWSLLFATTIVALVVAAGLLVPEWRVGAGVVAVFLLLSQVEIFGGIGLAFADYSAMMLVTVGVAIYLYGHRSASAGGRVLWPALALGVVTLAAVKSKETGLILAWPTVLMLWESRRMGRQQLRRRAGFWIVGAGAATLLLMAVDGLILEDFWFRMRPETWANARELNAAAHERWDLTRWAWLGVVWKSASLRPLYLLGALAVLVSLVRRRRLEQTLFVATPLVFLAMMIAIHPPIESPRYLFPIVPVACLVGAKALVDLGTGTRPERRLGRLRTALLAVAVLLLFGTGFERNRASLQRHWVRQQGETILYPWRQFRSIVETERPRLIGVSNRLYRDYGMIGRHITRERIARLFFRRGRLRLRSAPSLGRVGHLALGDYRELARAGVLDPGWSGRIEWDASGQIGLIVPERPPQGQAEVSPDSKLSRKIAGGGSRSK